MTVFHDEFQEDLVNIKPAHVALQQGIDRLTDGLNMIQFVLL
jgi:hypothetical protein